MKSSYKGTVCDGFGYDVLSLRPLEYYCHFYVHKRTLVLTITVQLCKQRFHTSFTNS